MYIELTCNKEVSNFSDRFNDSTFIDRVYQMLKEDGNDINYGQLISKYYANGFTKVLKSLNIYKVEGRGENKKILVHPRLKLIIETSILDAELVGKNIARLIRGEYNNLPFSQIDLTNFNLLKCSKAKKEAGLFSTYIVYNPLNNLYKIGRSKNVFQRFNKLKAEHGLGLIFFGYNEADYEAEIHFEYRECREFGEWFSISTNQALEIFSEYKFIELKEKHLSLTN